MYILYILYIVSMIEATERHHIVALVVSGREENVEKRDRIAEEN